MNKLKAILAKHKPSATNKLHTGDGSGFPFAPYISLTPSVGVHLPEGARLYTEEQVEVMLMESLSLIQRDNFAAQNEKHEIQALKMQLAFMRSIGGIGIVGLVNAVNIRLEIAMHGACMDCLVRMRSCMKYGELYE